MSHLPAHAHELLRRQHGVISRAQLTTSGLSRRQVTTLVERGDLVSGLRGTFRTPSAPIDQLSRCTEVCLARPAVAVSAPTAGCLRGWRMVNRDRRVHVISPPASNPAIAPWVVPYRTAAIHAERDIVHRDDGIRTTTPARTVLDLARTLDTTALASVIDQAIAKHGVTEDELIATAIDWRSRQRPWIDVFLRVLGQRLPGGPADSHPEIRVGNGLRVRGVRHLVRQHAIVLPGSIDARFDLAVPELLWAVEVDVYPTHVETGGVAKDERRDDAAEAIGWTVSRISEADYERRLDARLDELVEVYRALRSRTNGER
jgi:very-short-patch-repair endonuclease